MTDLKKELNKYSPLVLDMKHERIDYETTMNLMTVVEFVGDLITIIQSKFMIMHEHGFITLEFGGISNMGL